MTMMSLLNKLKRKQQKRKVLQLNLKGKRKTNLLDKLRREQQRRKVLQLNHLKKEEKTIMMSQMNNLKRKRKRQLRRERILPNPFKQRKPRRFLKKLKKK